MGGDGKINSISPIDFHAAVQEESHKSDNVELSNNMQGTPSVLLSEIPKDATRQKSTSYHIHAVDV